MKYDVVYSCGHTGQAEVVGKIQERQRKLDWMAQGICKECYKAQRQQELENTPIALNAILHPYAAGNAPIVLYWSGNTKPEKEKIKELKYEWGYIPGLGTTPFKNQFEQGWFKWASFDRMDQEIEAAKQIGAIVVNKKVFKTDLVKN